MIAVGTGLRYRLVGLGRYTSGVTRDLQERTPVVVGRHAECTISIPHPPAAGPEVPMLSRVHAVIEPTAGDGWSVCDSGSTNGTTLLRQGLPPTMPLEASRLYPLAPGDVIELAGTSDFQFLFQALPAASPADIGATQQLARRAGRVLQQLVDGHGSRVIDIPASIATRPLGLRLGRLPGGGIWPLADDQAARTIATVHIVDARVVLQAQSAGVTVNQQPLAVGSPRVLHDKDVIVIPGDPPATLLLLDPEAIAPRRLSDLLLDAERVTFGSADDNTCRLADVSVSRHHAEIWRDGDGLHVRDLGSLNGTVLNDQRLSAAARLHAGQRLWIGRLPFIVDTACFERVMPRRPDVDIRFVRVSIEIAGKLRLRQVSFGVRQGEMVGVLGPSASGKSTLLRALAGQQKMASGDIYVNGRSVSRHETGEWFQGLLGFGPDTREVGFVQQIDLLQPNLTVRELLQFAARHMGLAGDEARARADHAGDLCNLGTLLDRVALSGNGQMNLSGGQLKRVCVALEVLRQPRVLVLDEPTTGQDPKNTNDLMNLFRRLTREGVTLLMSTHDLRNLSLFDKVIVVTLGHLAYFGPPEQFAPFFAATSAEDVYASLPDREDRLAEAERLAQTFRAHPLYAEYCEVEA